VRARTSTVKSTKSFTCLITTGKIWILFGTGENLAAKFWPEKLGKNNVTLLVRTDAVPNTLEESSLLLLDYQSSLLLLDCQSTLLLLDYQSSLLW
jgi:hypothetical protein